jgi:hypothetical protein
VAIAVSSSGRTFRAIATYLALGRSGDEPERVGWSASRNLPTDDPQLAARFMRATAEQNVRVEKPVYHFAISFDPTDPVDRATLERVADRVLDRLGLREHEAILVAHRDREHAHVHVLVNRVHPVTGRAWDRWQDHPVIQQVLREEERALGIREVRGRLYELPDRHPERVKERSASGPNLSVLAPSARSDRGDTVAISQVPPAEVTVEASRGRDTAIRPVERSPLTSGEHRQAERSGETAFVDRVRGHVPALRAAKAWGDLEATLAYHGLQLERRGQGLVVTDGEHFVKASRVARDLGMRALEARFGSSYDGYVLQREGAIERLDRSAYGAAALRLPHPSGARQDVGLVPSIPLSVDVSRRGAPGDREDRGETSGGKNPDSNTVRRLVQRLETYEQVRAVFGEHFAATQSLSAARARLAEMEAREARARVATEKLERELARVYRDPAGARHAFEKSAVQRGIDHAVEQMRTRPEQLGRLVTVERQRTLGLVRTQDDSQARAFALIAAVQGREAWHARAGLPAPAEHEAAREGVSRGVERERAARDARSAHADQKSLLEREIGHLISRLVPRELEELRRAVTQPQLAMALQLKRAVREALLDRGSADG